MGECRIQQDNKNPFLSSDLSLFKIVKKTSQKLEGKNLKYKESNQIQKNYPSFLYMKNSPFQTYYFIPGGHEPEI